MNKNVRIAKELLRIAKSLMADDEQQKVEQVMKCIENGSEMPSFVTNDPTVQKAVQEIQQSSKRIMRMASSRRSFQANVLKTIMDKARKLVPTVGLALALGFAGTAAAAEGVPQKQVADACQEMVIHFLPKKSTTAKQTLIKDISTSLKGTKWKEVDSLPSRIKSLFSGLGADQLNPDNTSERNFEGNFEVISEYGKASVKIPALSWNVIRFVKP